VRTGGDVGERECAGAVAAGGVRLAEESDVDVGEQFAADGADDAGERAGAWRGGGLLRGERLSAEAEAEQEREAPECSSGGRRQGSTRAWERDLLIRQ